MSKFAFYLGPNASLANQIEQAATSMWGIITKRSIDSFWLYFPSDEDSSTILETEFGVGAVSGYARKSGLDETSGRKFDLDRSSPITVTSI